MPQSEWSFKEYIFPFTALLSLLLTGLHILGILGSWDLLCSAHNKPVWLMGIFNSQWTTRRNAGSSVSEEKAELTVSELQWSSSEHRLQEEAGRTRKICSTHRRFSPLWQTHWRFSPLWASATQEGTWLESTASGKCCGGKNCSQCSGMLALGGRRF